MSDQYNHGQRADMRQLSAMATSQKSGSAFEGHAPRERSSWPIVGVAALLIILAIGAFHL